MAALALRAALAFAAARPAPTSGRSFVWLAALAILASGAIGVYHAGVEPACSKGFTQCTVEQRRRIDAEICSTEIMATPLIRCDQVQWSLFGISMAGWNAILSIGFAIGDPMAEPQTPSPGPLAPAHRRPGVPATRAPTFASMLRVDQAGEYGATRIYAGQLAVLGDRHPASRARSRGWRCRSSATSTISTRMLAERGVRPTLLQPIWNVAGHALGAVTALIGPEAAMACTAAVEDRDRPALCRAAAGARRRRPGAVGDDRRIPGRRARASRHRACGRRRECASLIPLLSAAIRAGCRAAIALSKRI